MELVKILISILPVCTAPSKFFENAKSNWYRETKLVFPNEKKRKEDKKITSRF
jgi:hypothetical protein